MRRISIVAALVLSSIADYAHVQHRCQVSYLRLPLLIQLDVSDGACFDLHAEHQPAKDALAGRAVPPSATSLLGYSLWTRSEALWYRQNYLRCIQICRVNLRSRMVGAGEIISSIDTPRRPLFNLGAKELTPSALACILRCQS